MKPFKRMPMPKEFLKNLAEHSPKLLLQKLLKHFLKKLAFSYRKICQKNLWRIFYSNKLNEVSATSNKLHRFFLKSSQIALGLSHRTGAERRIIREPVWGRVHDGCFQFKRTKEHLRNRLNHDRIRWRRTLAQKVPLVKIIFKLNHANRQMPMYIFFACFHQCPIVLCSPPQESRHHSPIQIRHFYACDPLVSISIQSLVTHYMFRRMRINIHLMRVIPVIETHYAYHDFKFLISHMKPVGSTSTRTNCWWWRWDDDTGSKKLKTNSLTRRSTLLPINGSVLSEGCWWAYWVVTDSFVD